MTLSRVSGTISCGWNWICTTVFVVFFIATVVSQGCARMSFKSWAFRAKSPHQLLLREEGLLSVSSSHSGSVIQRALSLCQMFSWSKSVFLNLGWLEPRLRSSSQQQINYLAGSWSSSPYQIYHLLKRKYKAIYSIASIQNCKSQMLLASFRPVFLKLANYRMFCFVLFLYDTKFYSHFWYKVATETVVMFLFYFICLILAKYRYIVQASHSFNYF